MTARPPRVPTVPELDKIAADLGLTLTQRERDGFLGLIAGAVNLFGRIDELPKPGLPSRYPRTPGHSPDPADNPFNAWYWRCEIEGAASGPLCGLRVGVKDSICVAGVPMMNGTRLLEGYVPEFDATVVTRLLDAGATIVGKTTTPEFTIAGGPHASAYGPVRNPHRPTHSPGASSNGSGAAVAAGDVELALGGDQGGSIRYPASWCGIVGLKPTFGLVPYTGCMPIEITLDHVGPMTDTVEHAAAMLTAIAGPDGFDPRQAIYPAGHAPDYLAECRRDVNGLRIGVLKEGFGQAPWTDLGLPGSEPVVDEAVRAAVHRLQAKGANIEEVSIPMHFDAARITLVVLIEGMMDTLFKGAGAGSNWEGFYPVSLMETLSRNMRSSANELPVNARYLMVLAEYMKRAYGGRYYGRAQNLRPSVRAAYDEMLARYDALVMPSTPTRAFPLAPPDHDLAEAVALRGLANQCQFNLTGHPALSIPCGAADDLPIGMQIVGRRFDDAMTLRVGRAIEETLA